jgi:hypothetical protein
MIGVLVFACVTVAGCSHPTTDRARQGTTAGANESAPRQNELPQDGIWCVAPLEQPPCFSTPEECDRVRRSVLGDGGECDLLTPAPGAPPFPTPTR